MKIIYCSLPYHLFLNTHSRVFDSSLPCCLLLSTPIKPSLTQLPIHITKFFVSSIQNQKNYLQLTLTQHKFRIRGRYIDKIIRKERRKEILVKGILENSIIFIKKQKLTHSEGPKYMKIQSPRNASVEQQLKSSGSQSKKRN